MKTLGELMAMGVANTGSQWLEARDWAVAAIEEARKHAEDWRAEAILLSRVDASSQPLPWKKSEEPTKS